GSRSGGGSDDRGEHSPRAYARGRPCTWGRPGSESTRGQGSFPEVLGEVEAEPLEVAGRTSPVRQDFHPQIQIHRLTDKSLDLLAGYAAELANLGSPVPDEDSLLAFALDVDDCPNVPRLPIFAELLDLAGDAVGNLLVELLERGLAHQLGDEEAGGLRADVVLGIEERALGQMGCDLGEECIDAFAGGGGDRIGVRPGGAELLQRLGRDGI